MNLNGQIVKGQWNKGHLLYTELNKFKEGEGELKKEKVIFNVRSDKNSEDADQAVSSRKHIEIIGPAEITFIEKSTSILYKPENQSSSQPTYKHMGSLSYIQSHTQSGQTLQTNSVVSYPAHYPRQIKFFGEFFKAHQTLSQLFGFEPEENI